MARRVGSQVDTPSASSAAEPVVSPSGVDRRYFLEADPVQWDYALLGHDGITGEPFSDAANVLVKSGPSRIGSSYQKCLYRGYTDNTFTSRKARAAEDADMGLLGPTIHAEVGDTITVVFRSICSFPASVHPHGVMYDKGWARACHQAGQENSVVHVGYRHRGRPAHTALARQHGARPGMRTDMQSLLPGMMMTADMVSDNAGIWLFHCHVNDHIAAGMSMRYRVS